MDIEWWITTILIVGIITFLLYMLYVRQQIEKEYQFSIESTNLIYKWICIRRMLNDPIDQDRNYYNLFLKDDDSFCPTCRHIWDVWYRKEDYEEVFAYVKEHYEVWEDFHKLYNEELGLSDVDL